MIVAPLVLILAGCRSEMEDDTPAEAVAIPEPIDAVTRNRALDRVKARIASGDESQARADAMQAAKDGEFGLIASGDFLSAPTGVTCFTPAMRAPVTLMTYDHGDVITQEVRARTHYAAAYNRALVDRPDYPDRDLCRIGNPREQLNAEAPALVTRSARAVAAPPRDLFEAARRGGARDVQRFLNGKTINMVDGIGMSALAWATARNNRTAIKLLLAAGANPWLTGAEWGTDGTRSSAVYWAAALGRGRLFEQLARRRGRPFDSWPSTYVSAAMVGSDASILRQMLAEPNQGVRIEFLMKPLPDAALFEMVLKRQPELAEPLLFAALYYSNDRPDLARLALAHGANPNAVDSYESALAKVSDGIAPSSVEMVDMLLKAGADPNMASHRTRPIWEAVNVLTLDRDVNEVDIRAKLIFHKLIAAGAKLNLPDWQDRPPAWFMLFPKSYAHEELDASFVTPELLEMLVRNGLDLNAQWKRKRVLGHVEAQAGRNSELAQTLRRLGAKH